MAGRTRAQAAANTPTDLGAGVTVDENGNLINDRGYPMAKPDVYELEIMDVELREFPPNKFSPEGSEAWQVDVVLLGTKQGVGEFADEPFRARIFINKPRRDNLTYDNRTTKEKDVPTHAANFLLSMGLQLPRKAKFSKVDETQLIGGFLKAYVGHNSNGYHDIRIEKVVKLPNGTFENRGIFPVVNPEHLEANRALADKLFVD